MKERFMRTLSLMSTFFSFWLWTHGMRKLLFTCKPWRFLLTCYLSRDEHRWLRYVAKNYLIVDETLYCHGVDSIFCRCLTHEEAESMVNDCHGGKCGGHLSRLSTTQNILRAGYFWLSIFKDCVDAVKRCHPCQVFTRNMHSKPAPLHPISPPVPSLSGGSILWIAT